MMVFVIVGMPASGKNIARGYAGSKEIPYFASGDIVRAEVKNRGLEPNAANTSAVSTELRGNDGLGVTRKVLASALDAGSPVCFMEGMRSWTEIELIRKKTACVVVTFLAPRALRIRRIIARGRSDDSPEAFEERDMREIAYGAAVPIALSDEYILNTGTFDEAVSRLDDIVRRHSS
jgi:dephospho-CoA kinase